MITKTMKANQAGKSIRSRGGMTRRHRGATLVILTAAMASGWTGCLPEETGANINDFLPLSISGVKVTKPRANVGDSVTVTWTLNGSSNCVGQSIWLIPQTPFGIGEPTEVTLSKSTRSYMFTFQGPVTVDLVVEGGHDFRTNFVFDVLLNEDYYFEMSKVIGTHPDHPRLGYSQDTRWLESFKFTNFLGIYDRNSNGLIDDLSNYSVGGVTLSRYKEFMQHTTSVQEGFGYTPTEGPEGGPQPMMPRTFGSKFANLDLGFFETEDGAPLRGRYTRSNAVVFAGGLSYDGVDTTATDSKGNQVPARRNVKNFDPIFASVHLLIVNNVIYLTEIDVGNVDQGLTTSLYRGVVLGRSSGEWSVEASLPNNQGPGEIEGSVCEAVVGWSVTTVDGEVLRYLDEPGVFVQLGVHPIPGKPCEGGLSWNVPFVWDDNIW